MAKTAVVQFNSRNYMPPGLWELWYQSNPVKVASSKQVLIEWAESHAYVVA